MINKINCSQQFGAQVNYRYIVEDEKFANNLYNSPLVKKQIDAIKKHKANCNVELIPSIRTSTRQVFNLTIPNTKDLCVRVSTNKVSEYANVRIRNNKYTMTTFKNGESILLNLQEDNFIVSAYNYCLNKIAKKLGYSSLYDYMRFEL